MKVHGMVDLQICDGLGVAPKDKPYLRITAPDGTVMCITTNVGEMIGGASKGARLRWEEEHAHKG